MPIRDTEQCLSQGEREKVRCNQNRDTSFLLYLNNRPTFNGIKVWRNVKRTYARMGTAKIGGDGIFVDRPKDEW